MQNGLAGPQLGEVVQLLRDIALECAEGNGNLGEHIPAVRDFGERADNILHDLFGSYNIEDIPPTDDVVIGFSEETTEALESMRKTSRRLARLLMRDFGEAAAV